MSEVPAGLTVPVWRALPRLIRNTHQALVDFGNESGGGLVRLDLGVFKPYLVTHPALVQEVLQDRAAIYPRGEDTPLWRSVARLAGDRILGEGEPWKESREVLAPVFRRQRVEMLIDPMAEAIDQAVTELSESEPVRAGAPIDIGVELSRIVCKAIMNVFFADRITVADALRIMDAQETIVTSMALRLLVPWVPWSVRLPGDQRFTDAVQAINDILYPAIREALDEPGDGEDVLSTLGRGFRGQRLTEKQMRDDVVAMVAVTTETTYVVLTWLFPILNAHPDVAERLYREIDEVVGADQVRADHLPRLVYTRMVLEELLRLYPAGWIVPRRAAADDVLGGVRIGQGSTIVLSPYTTQRMSAWWGPTAEVFDPERWSPERVKASGRHRYAHYPFGGGGHVCLGMHLFNLEALLIVPTLLSRFRFTLTNPAIPGRRVAASLRQAERVKMTLQPIRATRAA